MMRKVCLLLTFLGISSGFLRASPMTANELDLLVRMHTPEDQILAEVAERRLLGALDDAGAKKLTADGASANLITKLRGGAFTVSEADAAQLRAAAARQSAYIAGEKQKDEQASAARRLESPQYIRSAPTSDKMMRLLDGKLLRMVNRAPASVSSQDLRNVRYFAFYFSASWCQPCKMFTPQLVEFYKEAKKVRPEFEIIFVSADRSAEKMEAYMQDDQMPWPAVRYDAIDASIRKFGARFIPWLTVVTDDGVTVLPITDQSSSAFNTLPALSKLLAVPIPTTKPTLKPPGHSGAVPNSQPK